MSLPISVNCQQASWAFNIGNAASDQGYDISNDAFGNVYITGWFSGTAQFGNQTLVSYGQQDIFLASYDSNGNLNWARQAGSSENDVSAGIAAMPNGDTYITGWFRGSCSFSGSSVASQGDYDMFIAKYNAYGDIQWVRSGGGLLDDYGNRVTLTADGGATVAGSFKSTFIAGDVQTISQGNRDILICHYSSDGELDWIRGIGGNGEDRAYGIAQDSNGDYFITGVFSDGVDFDGTLLTCNSFFATYLAKLSEQGNVLWAVKGDAGANDFARGFGVAVDQEGNVITNGFFSGKLIMGGATLLASGGQYDQDTYLIKFSGEGILIWSRSSGGGMGVDQATDILLTSADEILEVGFFHDTATFGNGTISAAGLADIFISRYDSSGNTLAVSSYGGEGNEYGYGIATDNDGAVYLAGVITGESTIGNIPLVSAGGNDILVAKLNLSPLGLSHWSELAPVTIYPNPANQLIQINCKTLQQSYNDIELTILDQNGRTVYSDSSIGDFHQIDISNWASGLYLMHLFGPEFSSVSKLVVER